MGHNAVNFGDAPHYETCDLVQLSFKWDILTCNDAKT